jgi:hypothetical protein
MSHEQQPGPINFDNFSDKELPSIITEDAGTWNEIIARTTLEYREDCQTLIEEATRIIDQGPNQ